MSPRNMPEITVGIETKMCRGANIDIRMEARIGTISAVSKRGAAVLSCAQVILIIATNCANLPFGSAFFWDLTAFCILVLHLSHVI